MEVIAALNAKSPKNGKFSGLGWMYGRSILNTRLLPTPTKANQLAPFSTLSGACMSIKALLILAYMRLLVYKAFRNGYAFVHCNRS